MLLFDNNAERDTRKEVGGRRRCVEERRRKGAIDILFDVSVQRTDEQKIKKATELIN